MQLKLSYAAITGTAGIKVLIQTSVVITLFYGRISTGIGVLVSLGSDLTLITGGTVWGPFEPPPITGNSGMGSLVVNGIWLAEHPVGRS